MEVISILEKAKDNLLSFLLGCIVAAAGAYIVMEKLHSKEVEIIRLDSEVKTTSVKAEMEVLKKRVSDLEKKNILLTQKNNYKTSLSGIEDLIARIDEEITHKKIQIRMAASTGISIASEDDNKKSGKSDYYIELERELGVTCQYEKNSNCSAFTGDTIQIDPIYSLVC
ncbi:hypothetical protein [Teredinibacter waterburyi]|uniref:hypothetical protein n=1 Tax=Teredinibacter waterburyi TaxID=1500538 RepID=UPI00165F1AF9|nr:hypothetical protein [Teredinibacter waterburyi]